MSSKFRLRPLLQASSLLFHQPHQVSPFLVPLLHTPYRAASILSALSDNPGAYNKKIRRGRGPSSGKGRSSGRGLNGQKARGKAPRGFNGGQTPDYVLHPPRGTENRNTNFSLKLALLNLDHLLEWIAQGRINPSRPITLKELADSRCVNPRKIGDGIKLLARGSEKLTIPINIIVSRASAAAIAAIEAAGGSVMTRYYTPFSVIRILQGKTDPINSLLSQPDPRLQMPQFTSNGTIKPEPKKAWPIRLPDPAGRKAIEYYRDPAHRGYLSYQLAEGQGPSLFFKPPRPAGAPSPHKSEKTKRAAAAVANRLW
ncbi:YmL10 [Pseudocyphellaria aurata]|nr:YmL10 [Pseudocyphellaria aurata]